VGHPLFDELAEEPPDEEVVANLQSDDKPRVIGLFPGSRTQEVTRHLPVMLTSCRTLQKQLGGLSFALVCPEAVREPVERILQEKEMEVALPDTRAIELARAADLCLTKSGTITLEIASQHCPMVIFYRVSAFSWFLASGLRPEFLSLVNTLAGDNICPEKLMWRDDREWLATQASKLLMDSDARDICIRNLKQVMKPIAHPGASEKTAELALEMADH
jgi:lipid-A-disaccharide synthase